MSHGIDTNNRSLRTSNTSTDYGSSFNSSSRSRSGVDFYGRDQMETGGPPRSIEEMLAALSGKDDGFDVASAQTMTASGDSAGGVEGMGDVCADIKEALSQIIGAVGAIAKCVKSFFNLAAGLMGGV